MIVFAYGSNLSLRQMKTRCPSARVIGVGELKGWRLSYAGGSKRWRGAVATIVKDPHGAVPGVVYDIPEIPDVERLERHEGFPHTYDRRFVLVTVRGRAARKRAWAYYHNEDEGGWPSEAYFRTIVAGYRDHGLPVHRLYKSLDRLLKRRPARNRNSNRKRGAA
jgi:cation transport regulator ChaC